MEHPTEMGNSKSCHHEYILREMPHRVRELHIAVTSNDRDAVRMLVAQGVNINFPFLNPSNPSIKDGNTPLIIAVSLNYTEIVEVSREIDSVVGGSVNMRHMCNFIELLAHYSTNNSIQISGKSCIIYLLFCLSATFRCCYEPALI